MPTTSAELIYRQRQGEYADWSARDLITNKIKCERSEWLGVDSLFLEESLTDSDHVIHLAGLLINGERGQLQELGVRARLDPENGEIVHDITDGYHRAAAFTLMQKCVEEGETPEGVDLFGPGYVERIAQMFGERVGVRCNVMYGCNDEEMYGLRVVAASSVKSVKFSRMTKWITRAFECTAWKSAKVATMIDSGELRASQVFGLLNNQSSGVGLHLQSHEANELKKWAQGKVDKWGVSVGKLAQDLRLVEMSAPDVVEQVRVGGGGHEGAGILNPKRFEVIVTNLPGKHDLQRKLVDFVIQYNLVSDDLAIIVKLVAEANDRDDPVEVDWILANPFEYVKKRPPAERKKKRAKTDEVKKPNPHLPTGVNHGGEVKRLLQKIEGYEAVILAQHQMLVRFGIGDVVSTDGENRIDTLHNRVGGNVMFRRDKGYVYAQGAENNGVCLTQTETKLLALLLE